jgi:hypothetical protein
LGNYQSAGYYQFLSSVSLTPDYALGSGNGDPLGTRVQGASLPSFANTTLTWEKAKTTSVGIDAVLLTIISHLQQNITINSRMTLFNLFPCLPIQVLKLPLI